MKIVVIGANGQLGSDICEAFESEHYPVVPLTIEDIDISDKKSVSAAFEKLSDVGVVINTAAMHHVEKCEEDPVRSFEVNGIGAIHLAEAVNKMDALLVHISTDYVFDGTKREPYTENDRPVPLNVYANTKLSGEHFVESIAKKYQILRVSGIYGKNPCMAKGHNFVDLMLKLAKEREEVRVVDNEILTPTATEDIARQMVKMIRDGAEYGIYHVTAEGSCSWHEFAAEIFSVAGSSVTLNVAAPGEFPTSVNRPEYSVLENEHLKAQNLNIMPHWKEGLKAYITKYRM
jgi:dTDP-4-dehydrorhamnose reductase